MSITPEQIDEAIKYCFNEVEDTGLRRIDVHDGSYDCFKYHGNTILTALEMVRELTQDDESSLMAKGNAWQPIDHDDIRAYQDEVGLYGIWVTNNKTGERYFENYKLYLDDEMNMRTADDFADYHSEWAFNDYEYFMPAPTPPKESE